MTATIRVAWNDQLTFQDAIDSKAVNQSVK
jgi:hypothetical protein